MQETNKQAQSKTNADFNKSQFQGIEQFSNEPLLAINADIQEPIKYVCLWVVIGVISLIIFLIALGLPSVFIYKSNEKAFESESCMNPIGFDGNNMLYCQKFSNSTPVIGFVLNDVENLNQFAQLIFQIIVLNRQATFTFHLEQEIQLQIYKVDKMINNQNQIGYRFAEMLQDQKINYTFTSLYHSFSPLRNQQEMHDTFVKDDDDDEDEDDDDDDKGNKRFSGMYSSLSIEFTDRNLVNEDNQNKYYRIQFSDTSQFKTLSNIQFSAVVVNPQFTVFTIVIRYVFLGLSILGAVIYLRRYFQLKQKDRIFELKLVSLLCILQILFNDPFYAITVLAPNPVTTFFSVFFVLIFQIYLLLAYLVIFQRINDEKSSRNTQMFDIKKSWPKLVIFSILFILSMITFCQFAYISVSSDWFVPQGSGLITGIVVTFIIVLIIFAAIAVWIAFIYGQIISKCCADQLLWREKQLIIILPFFFILFCIIFFTEAVKSYNYETAIWPLYGYCFSNLFCFIMEYLFYTPSWALEGANRNQDMQFAHNEIGSDLDYDEEDQ